MTSLKNQALPTNDLAFTNQIYVNNALYDQFLELNSGYEPVFIDLKGFVLQLGLVSLRDFATHLLATFKGATTA